VHSLSALTERQAKAFIARIKDDDVCISYDVDASGQLLFARELGRPLTRLPLAVSLVAAVAACSPSRAERAEKERASASEAAAPASANAAAACAADRAKEDQLKQALNSAPDEASRAKLQAELSKVLEERQRRDGSVRHVAGAMRMPPVQGRNGPCKCPPGDPLCSCL